MRHCRFHYFCFRIGIGELHNITLYHDHDKYISPSRKSHSTGKLADSGQCPLKRPRQRAVLEGDSCTAKCWGRPHLFISSIAAMSCRETSLVHDSKHLATLSNKDFLLPLSTCNTSMTVAQLPYYYMVDKTEPRTGPSPEDGTAELENLHSTSHESARARC